MDSFSHARRDKVGSDGLVRGWNILAPTSKGRERKLEMPLVTQPDRNLTS